MATTQIVQFCSEAAGAGGNRYSPTAWAALTTLLAQGFQSGTASSEAANTALAQATFMAAGLANFCVAQGVSVPDDGNLTSLVGELTAALSVARAPVSCLITSPSASATFTKGSFSGAINLATTGANGMDNGTAPISGYVAIYEISGASGTAWLAQNATSAAAPSVYAGAYMPSGYNTGILVSVWPTNGSGQFIQGLQIDRTLSINSTAALASSTSVGSTPISLSISGTVPANAKSVSGAIFLSNTTASNLTVEICANAAGLGATWVSGYINADFEFVDGYFSIPILTPQTIYYSSVSSGGTPTYSINISGYTI